MGGERSVGNAFADSVAELASDAFKELLAAHHYHPLTVASQF
jgi:hypothetical protein